MSGPDDPTNPDKMTDEERQLTARARKDHPDSRVAQVDREEARRRRALEQTQPMRGTTQRFRRPGKEKAG